MQLVFLHGPPACGKLTIAKELASLTGMRLFHNHLTVDLVTALFDFGSKPFIQLRESIWLDAFAEAARQNKSLIFTFNPEATVGPDFPQRTMSAVAQHAGEESGEVVFIELTCPEPEIERRIENESRAEYGKLRSVEQYRQLRESGAFAYPPLPKPVLRIDTGSIEPRAAAERIASLLAAES